MRLTHFFSCSIGAVAEHHLHRFIPAGNAAGLAALETLAGRAGDSTASRPDGGAAMDAAALGADAGGGGIFRLTDGGGAPNAATLLWLRGSVGGGRFAGSGAAELPPSVLGGDAIVCRRCGWLSAPSDGAV